MSSGKVVAKSVNGQYTAGSLADCLPAWLCGGNGPNVTAGLLPRFLEH